MTAIVLPQVITHDNAASVLSLLSLKLPVAGDVEVDAGALLTFDSSAISVLLGLARLAHGTNQRFNVINWPALLWSLVQAYDVAQVLSNNTEMA